MFDVNVLGVLRVVKAFLPALIESGRGDIVVMSSTAGHQAYEGGGGYVAAKHGTHSIAATLRLELAGEPVRVIEIAPGMVATEEFTLKRVGGSQDKADKVYEGGESTDRRRRRRRRRLLADQAAPLQRRSDGDQTDRTGRTAQSRTQHRTLSREAAAMRGDRCAPADVEWSTPTAKVYD